MRYKQLKKELKKYKAIAYRQTELREHYESLFNTWVWELQFAKIQTQQLYNLLEEIKKLTNDKPIKKYIENWLEKHELNKAIHARNLFDK